MFAPDELMVAETNYEAIGIKVIEQAKEGDRWAIEFLAERLEGKPPINPEAIRSDEEQAANDRAPAEAAIAIWLERQHERGNHSATREQAIEFCRKYIGPEFDESLNAGMAIAQLDSRCGQ